MSGQRAFLAAALAAAALVASAAEALPDPFHAEDPRLWGTAAIIVTPEYPKTALLRHRTGYVDFEGWLTPTMGLDDIRYFPGSVDVNDFVDAVRQVAPFWRFYTYAGDDCFPKLARVRTRVWFDVDGDRPKITVAKSAVGEKDTREVRLEPTLRENPAYPRAMLELGYRAHVYARQDVDSTGQVTAVSLKAYSQDTRGLLTEFENSARLALSKWLYPAVRDPAKVRHVCVKIVYQLTNQ